jgi:hypothetical protein
MWSFRADGCANGPSFHGAGLTKHEVAKRARKGRVPGSIARRAHRPTYGSHAGARIAAGSVPVASRAICSVCSPLTPRTSVLLCPSLGLSAALYELGGQAQLRAELFELADCLRAFGRGLALHVHD